MNINIITQYLISKFWWLLILSPLPNKEPRHCSLPSLPRPSHFILGVSKFCFLRNKSVHTKAAHSLPASQASVRRPFSQNKGIVPRRILCNPKDPECTEVCDRVGAGAEKSPSSTLLHTLSPVFPTSLVCVWDVTYLPRNLKNRPTGWAWHKGLPALLSQDPSLSSPDTQLQNSLLHPKRRSLMHISSCQCHINASRRVPNSRSVASGFSPQPDYSQHERWSLGSLTAKTANDAKESRSSWGHSTTSRAAHHCKHRLRWHEGGQRIVGLP